MLQILKDNDDEDWVVRDLICVSMQDQYSIISVERVTSPDHEPTRRAVVILYELLKTTTDDLASIITNCYPINFSYIPNKDMIHISCS